MQLKLEGCIKLTGKQVEEGHSEEGPVYAKTQRDGEKAWCIQGPKTIKCGWSSRSILRDAEARSITFQLSGQLENMTALSRQECKDIAILLHISDKILNFVS